MTYEVLRRMENLAAIEARLARIATTSHKTENQPIPALESYSFETQSGFNVTTGDVVEWSHLMGPGTVDAVSDTHFRVVFSGEVQTYPGRQFTADKVEKRTHTLRIVKTGEPVTYWSAQPEAPDTSATVSDTGSITVAEAVEIINSIIFHPDWTFRAESYTGRFHDGVLVHVNYEARDSNRENAPEYKVWTPGGGRADFVIQVTGAKTRDDIARRLLTDVIMPIWEHESREFLRYPDTLDAPFHPHRMPEMIAWGTPEVDIKFGAA